MATHAGRNRGERRAALGPQNGKERAGDGSVERRELGGKWQRVKNESMMNGKNGETVIGVFMAISTNTEYELLMDVIGYIQYRGAQDVQGYTGCYDMYIKSDLMATSYSNWVYCARYGSRHGLSVTQR